MKRWYARLSFLVVVILVVVFGPTIVNSQVRKLEPIRPRVIERMKPIAILGPKIVMDRGQLESPKGMKLFRIQTLQIQPGFIEKLSQVHMFKMAPTTVRDKFMAARVQVYASNEKEFTKLLVDQERGHIELMPNLEKLEKMKVNLVREDMALNVANRYVADMKLIPQDSSQFMPRRVVNLGMASGAQGNFGPVVPKLQSVLFQRTIEGKPVMGDGSQLTVNVGDNGNIEGFQRKWNQLMPEATQGELEFRTDQEVYDKIEGLLKQQIQGNVEIRVATPRLVYFGNDRQYVQPAYFFSAALISPDGQGKAFYAGVVEAMKNPPEAIIEAVPDRVLPAAAPAEGLKTLQIRQPEPDDPTVGRYVVRNDSWDWVDDANDFKRGLENGHCGGCPAITFPQFFWNDPNLFTTRDNSYADSCNIALMEGHGNHWLFTTRSNCCDVVFLNNAAQPGYGAHAGGQMAYLILKGCDIIPSPRELSNWADPWWRIFKGLHQAIGFRTTMYINDNISYIFGYYLGKNCRVLDSWFYATNSSSSYRWQRFWGGEVTGYGAVVMIPGHEGDGIYYTAPAPDATSTGLTIWYQY